MPQSLSDILCVTPSSFLLCRKLIFSLQYVYVVNSSFPFSLLGFFFLVWISTGPGHAVTVGVSSCVHPSLLLHGEDPLSHLHLCLLSFCLLFCPDSLGCMFQPWDDLMQLELSKQKVGGPFSVRLAMCWGMLSPSTPI